MLKSKKHVFWEALLVVIGIFVIGLFLGMLIEASNTSRINDLYVQSEISLVDGMATSNFIEGSDLSCEDLKKSNIEFANKVYEEAKLLEQLESAGKLTEGMKYLHKKYDLLRTLLWMSNQNSLLKCDNYDIVVYLYEYDTEENVKKASQKVWSKILLDLKTENKDVLLLPVAADQNLTSLDLLIKEHQVTQLPALIVNNDHVLYEINNVNQVQSLLD